MGGVWERLIRTARNILDGLVKVHGHSLNDESLRTLLTEVESVMNSRPLTNDQDDPTGLNPLTPNHLLTMKSKVILPPPGNFTNIDLYSRKQWRRVQHLINEFWIRWQKEYLSTLQHRQKWNKSKRNFKVGDVVLMNNESQRNE